MSYFQIYDIFFRDIVFFEHPCIYIYIYLKVKNFRGKKVSRELTFADDSHEIYISREQTFADDVNLSISRE